MVIINYLKVQNLGSNKVIIFQAIVNNKIYSLHHNIKINNKTKFNDYWDQIKDSIQVNYDKDYMIDTYSFLKVLIWDLENKKIKI